MEAIVLCKMVSDVQSSCITSRTVLTALKYNTNELISEKKQNDSFFSVMNPLFIQFVHALSQTNTNCTLSYSFHILVALSLYMKQDHHWHHRVIILLVGHNFNISTKKHYLSYILKDKEDQRKCFQSLLFAQTIFYKMVQRRHSFYSA